MPFGLATFDSAYSVQFRRETLRRNIAYQNANGSAPLLAILSLLTPLLVDSPEWDWPEARLLFPNPKCVAYGGNGALSPVGSAPGSTLAVTVGTLYKIRVASLGGIGVSDVLSIPKTPLASGTIETLWTITAIDEATKDLTVRLESLSTGTTATLDNAAGKWPSGDTAVYALCLGKAMKEGSLSELTGGTKNECIVRNYAQIFRDGKSWTANALQAKSWTEPTGPYAKDMKILGRDHLYKMELSFLHGMRSKSTNSEGEVTRRMGGVKWYLKEWEAAGGGNAGYRPGEPAITANSDPQKRLIDLGGATVTRDTFETDYAQRIFNTTSNPSFEKLALVGPNVLPKLNAFYGDKLVRNTDLQTQNHFGMVNLFTLETQFGTIHFKTHPAFYHTNIHRNDMLILDVGNMSYAHTPERDTHVRENIQANDYDGRRDEFFSECSLELVHPENFLWFSGFGGLTN